MPLAEVHEERQDDEPARGAIDDMSGRRCLPRDLAEVLEKRLALPRELDAKAFACRLDAGGGSIGGVGEGYPRGVHPRDKGVHIHGHSFQISETDGGVVPDPRGGRRRLFSVR